MFAQFFFTSVFRFSFIAEKFIKVRNSSELFEASLDNFDEESNFVCPPQLHYNKDVMSITPCVSGKRKLDEHDFNKTHKYKNVMKKIYVNYSDKSSNPESTGRKFDDENDSSKDSVRNIDVCDLNLKNELMRGVIRPGRTGSFRAYDNESLWNALMDIKGGSSIYR